MTPRKPKILYILHDHLYGLAGTEQHTRHLVEGLADKYDTEVAFPFRNQIYLIDANKKIMRLPADAPEWPVTPFSAPKTERSLFMIINGFNPDIFHIQHFLRWPLCIMDQIIESGKPVIMSFHDYYTITPEYTMQQVNDAHETLFPAYSELVFKNDITSYLKKRRQIISQSLKKLSARIVPSHFIGEELGKIFPLDYQIIEHGIPPFEALPKVKRSSGLCFGFVGSLLPQKGWSELAEAFVPVQSKFPSTELHFYGGRVKVVTDDQKGVKFHGVYKHDDLPSIFSKIDIGVIPSIFREAYCLVLSEMSLAGLPVACSEVGALGERVINGKNGKTFPPGDIEAITGTLLWFLENSEWRRWYIPKPRLLEPMLKDYDNLYQSLLMA